MLPIEPNKRQKRLKKLEELAALVERLAGEHYHTTNMTDRDHGYIVRDEDMNEIRRLVNGL